MMPDPHAQLRIGPTLGDSPTPLTGPPRDRPDRARSSDIPRALPPDLQDGGWSQDLAHRWWERHRPEEARPAPTALGGLTLERAIGSEWAL